MTRLTWRASLGAVALAIAIAPAVPSAFSAPAVDLAGTWTLEGKNGAGHYKGTAKFSPDSTTTDGWIAMLSLKYDSGSSGLARFKGKLSGNVLKGKRQRTTGITNFLTGLTSKAYDASYTLSADGLTLEGTYASQFREKMTRKASPPSPSTGQGTLVVDSDRDGKLADADRQAASAGKSALLVLVPGSPLSAPAQAQVASGKVKLEVSPAGALKVTEGGKAVTELDQGTHDLKLEGVKEGLAEVRLLSGSTVLDKATVSVEKEKLYLILFAYMGTEINYEEGDLTRSKNNVLPKLKAAGYTVYEDGKSYDQTTLDKGLADARTSKKVVVDWCTTTADWNKYFDRGTVKGYVWSSHGFIEPFPGCPDSELKTFESRQWTAAPGDPSSTGDKHFIRQWKVKFDKNDKMDFGLNHACCTAGLGDYAHEPWEYCDSTTRSRAQALFGTLPTADQLKFVTHDSLKSYFTGFQQQYDGSSYFGMYDVRWDDLKAATKP